MSDNAVPGVATATAVSGDTVLGVQGGVVKRFGASPTFPQLAAITGPGLIGHDVGQTYSAGTLGDAVQTALAHIDDSVGAHAATAIANTPAGTIAATTVQAALNELDTDKQALAAKDSSGGYAGLTLFKLNLVNTLGTITSWFTTAATVARTWTMPDKDGTVAMTSDLTSFITSSSVTASETAAAASATAAAGSATTASGAATTATAQAVISTAQAVISTTQATAALTSETNAGASATSAAASAVAAAASAATLAAVPTSYDGTRDPTTTDDTANGASIGSQWLNTVTLVIWECVSATTNAALWNALGPGHPGYKSSRFYPTSTAIHNTGTAPGAIDILYVYPFILREKITVSSLVARIVTAGTSSSMKAAVWANKTQRPFGAPLLVDNTGIATNSSNAAASCTVSGTLNPGVYWIGSKFTGTLPQPISISSTDYTNEALIGRTAVGGNTALTALSIAATYSSNMPTFDGTETWVEYFGNGVPMLRLGVA